MYTKYAKIRDEKGYNDYAVCMAIGIAPSTMHSWKKNTENMKEGDKTPYLSAGTLKKIADLFEITVDELL